MWNPVNVKKSFELINEDLQWNSKSQLMEHDAPEIPGIVIVKSGATHAMQRAMNLQ